jgi:hypothetical protein
MPVHVLCMPVHVLCDYCARLCVYCATTVRSLHTYCTPTVHLLCDYCAILHDYCATIVRLLHRESWGPCFSLDEVTQRDVLRTRLSPRAAPLAASRWLAVWCCCPRAVHFCKQGVHFSICASSTARPAFRFRARAQRQGSNIVPHAWSIGSGHAWLTRAHRAACGGRRRRRPLRPRLRSSWCRCCGSRARLRPCRQRLRRQGPCQRRQRPRRRRRRSQRSAQI